jgi:hypothetical protein
MGCQTQKKTSAVTKSTEESSEKTEKKNPYDKIVTKTTETDDGLFLVHRNKEKLYYEIPDSLLGKEMLWISRIAALPANYGGGYVNAGSKTNEQVVRWVQKFDKILLKEVSYNAVAPDSLPIYKSVTANNYEPILYSFKVEGKNPAGNATLIEVTDLFTKDVYAFSPLNSRLRKDYQVRRLDSDRSFIESAKSFPLNIEVKHDLTFEASNPPAGEKTGSLSFLMNQSMVLLPETLMETRPYDQRVGWFTVSQIDYGSPLLKADQRRLIRKWNLVPKDPAAYGRGELVEPVKPIVYYLDPATPEQFRKYFKEGIELWQQAFETAGFKNAILAKDPPSIEEDPDFSPEDVRYSVVRYVASTTRNAVGPSVSDPRTGEIIESDIIWYHNHLRSYRNRYLLETGAANPSARTLLTSDEEIGEMMKMVIAHEVGHALGLPHNMKASSAYPVDSLRSGSFTQEYGIAATIMDYARYNYVAQPGDENIRFIRQLGPYDHYAINWGYRYLPETITESRKKEILNSWIKEKEGDPVYMFGYGYGGYDPDSQTEGIGNDPVRASEYGLSNLKMVAQNLRSWTSTPGENYEDLEELYGEMLGVWYRYIGHVVTNIGGINETLKTTDQEGLVYEVLPEEEQKRSMNFLLKEAFGDPSWLVNKDIVSRINASGAIERLGSLQSRLLERVLDTERINRMVEAEIYSSDTYSATEMMGDLRKGLWSELISARSISPFRRSIQRAYIDQLSSLIHPEDIGRGADPSESDVQALSRAQLEILRTDIRNARTRMSDDLSRYHLNDALARIDKALSTE